MKSKPESAKNGVPLVAEKLVGGGQALAHHDGATWMVAGALPGESVRAEPIRRRAGIVEARTVTVISEPHPARTDNPCPESGICGGCDWPHVDPIRGAELKAAAAAEAARAFPGLAARIASASIHKSENAYRLRARLHWDGGQQRLGFYEHRSRRVASIEACRILSPRLMRALPVLAGALASCCAEHVDVEWIEASDAADTVVALRPAKGGPTKINREWVPGPDESARVVSGFHSISQGGNLRPGWGVTEVGIDLPVPLKVPVGAFFQANRHLIKPLFARVAELIGADPAPVFDLHAGVGFLAAAAFFAGQREMTLVEPHRLAALAARRNLPDARVVAGTTAEAFVAGGGGLPEEAIAITDPPRTGLSKDLRRSLVRWQPQKIVMLGCDPATWARDAGLLNENGYRTQLVEIFDLFPSTHHLEILALLERV